jgi:hypothetical protein
MTIQTEKTTQIKDEIKINKTRIPTAIALLPHS